MSSEQENTRIPVRIIRGGSSKGIFVRVADLPQQGPKRDALVFRLFGTPDVRQIDGLGGADKLTSKFAVMGPPTRQDCDISYLFAQVGTEFADVDWDSNCGNISSGAALFAALERIGRKQDGQRIIAIEQANTGCRLLASIPLNGENPARTGDFAIGGVPGTGPRINLDFADFDGSYLNRGVFPTGQRIENLTLPDQAPLSVTILDMGNLNVCVQAEDLGLDLTSSFNSLQENEALLDRLDQIRARVMINLGVTSKETATELIRRSVNPLIHILASPQSYRDIAGRTIKAKSHDVLSRSYARRAFSKAFPGTGAIGIGVGAFITGTLAARYGQNVTQPGRMRIGHASGCMTVDVALTETNAGLQINKACIGRTARLLLEGVAHLD